MRKKKSQINPPPPTRFRGPICSMCKLPLTDQEIDLQSVDCLNCIEHKKGDTYGLQLRIGPASKTIN